MEPDQAFGQALRSLRTRRKWSQTELALRADVNRNYISLIELGRNSPSMRLMFKLCDALDVSPSDLLKDIEKRMRAQASRLILGEPRSLTVAGLLASQSTQSLAMTCVEIAD